MFNFSEVVQLVGAVGVILSVLYLAVQIRQSTKMAQSEMLQALSTRLCERFLLVASEDSVADLIGLDWEKNDELTERQRIQIGYWITAVLTDLRDTFHQYELKVIPYDVLVGRTKAMKDGMFKTKMGKDAWQFHKESFEASFVTWFESIMDLDNIEGESGNRFTQT
jgi:hypothetical protein